MIDAYRRFMNIEAPPAPQRPKGFFTDTSLCIGCKACEVACKQWNQLPADGNELSGNSYDNTGALGPPRGGTSSSSNRRRPTTPAWASAG